MHLGMFLCRQVYNFAKKQQSLEKTHFLEKWVYLVFPEENHERCLHFLGVVMSSHGKSGLFNILRELARAMEPESASVPEALLQKQIKGETLTDWAFRLLTCIRINDEYIQEVDIPTRVINYIKKYTTSKEVKMELSRQCTFKPVTKLTRNDLIRICSEIDRITKFSGELFGPLVSVCSYVQNKETLAEKCQKLALENQKLSADLCEVNRRNLENETLQVQS